jgi:polar amino acid transport system ATP-binding protein
MPENIDRPETDPIVSLTDVNQSFGDNQVIKGISFDVAKGEVVCIIGPSGSGKSTLLRCINGLIEIDSGSIKVKDIEVHAPQLDKLALSR